MPFLSRALTLSAAAVALLPAAAHAGVDLTQGERFGTAPNEIVDLSSNGQFLVATQGKQVVRYDLGDLENPRQTAISAAGALVTGNGTNDNEAGPTSVALVRDQFVLVPYNDNNQTGIDPADGIKVLDATTLAVVRTISFAGGVTGAPTGAPGVDPLLEVPDSVAVSPDQTKAVVAVENDREVGQPATATNGNGGTPGFVRIDTSDANPANWVFELLSLPAPFLAAEGVDAQPEFVDIRADNTFAGTIQEANALVTYDLDTPGVATLPAPVSAGSSTFLADTVNDSPASYAFTTSLTQERQPDTVKWVAGGTLLALANEGENGAVGGSRDFSIHQPDGTLVKAIGTAFDRATADYGFLDETRNDVPDKGSEPEGMDVVSIGGVEHLLVLGERSESLSTWDISLPESPRLISHVPTGEAPEGIAASASRRFAIVANEEAASAIGNPGFFTLHRFSDTALLPEDRLTPRGSGTPYFNVRGLGAGFSPTRLPLVDGSVPTRVLSAEVGGRGYAPLRSVAPVGGAVVLEDVAPRPGGGSWVVSAASAFELARLNEDGSVAQVVDLPGGAASGVAVTPDGGTVYVSSSTTDVIYRYDVAAGTSTPIALSGGSARILDLSLAGDGDLLAVEADPNNPVSPAAIVRLDAPLTAATLGAGARTVLGTVPVASSRSSRDITGLALAPGGELWAVSGSSTGGDHYGTSDLRRLLTLAAPANRSAPAVTVAGATLTCSNGTWSDATSFTRQWRRDGQIIAGETGTTYVAGAADAGRQITCAVLAAGADAFAVAVSDAVVPGGVGATGPAGTAGGQGGQGPIGPQGPKGADGAQGPGGPAGPSGLTGAPGAAGPRGPAGPKGSTGKTGKAGPRAKVTCRVTRSRIRCTVASAKAKAAVVAKRGTKVVARTRTTTKGAASFRVPAGRGTLTVTVGGQKLR